MLPSGCSQSVAVDPFARAVAPEDERLARDVGRERPAGGGILAGGARLRQAQLRLNAEARKRCRPPWRGLCGAQGPLWYGAGVALRTVARSATALE